MPRRKKTETPKPAPVHSPAELALMAKYPDRRIVPATFGKFVTPEGEETSKNSVLIECAHEGCTAVRRVCTSDLFQVSMCHAHTLEAKRAKRRKNKPA